MNTRPGRLSPSPDPRKTSIARTRPSRRANGTSRRTETPSRTRGIGLNRRFLGMRSTSSSCSSFATRLAAAAVRRLGSHSTNSTALDASVSSSASLPGQVSSAPNRANPPANESARTMWNSARSSVRKASNQLGTSDTGPRSGRAALTTIAVPTRETRRNSQPAMNLAASCVIAVSRLWAREAVNIKYGQETCWRCHMATNVAP